MSETADLRSFVLDLLEDLGAEWLDRGPLTWVRLPDERAEALEVPSSFCMTFAPDQAGRFDAELVAPGSYMLERMLTAATRRGHWGAAKVDTPSGDWVVRALADGGVAMPDPRASFPVRLWDAWIYVFLFRVTLLADEKRESFHAIAVSEDGAESWPESLDLAEAPLVPVPWPADEPQVEGLYTVASRTLEARLSSNLEAFRRDCLSLLEEEVRRVFGYFDRTARELRDAEPSVSEDLVRAIEAERDRRLSEALERYDPKAEARLCGIRAVRVPTAEVLLPTRHGPIRVRTDPWTRNVRGLSCDGCGSTVGPWTLIAASTWRCARCVDATAGESARPREHPPSDTLPR